MGGNSIEEEKLIGAETEDVEEILSDALGTSVEMGRDGGVEGRAMPKGAGGELVGESPIGLGHRSQGPFQREIEGTPRRMSWSTRQAAARGARPGTELLPSAIRSSASP